MYQHIALQLRFIDRCVGIPNGVSPNRFVTAERR